MAVLRKYQARMALAAIAHGLMMVALASGDTVTWTGGAGTDSWHDGANWDLLSPPDDGDDVFIPDLLQPQVQYSRGTAQLNSVISRVPVAFTGGKLTVDEALFVARQLRQVGGTLGGDGTITVDGTLLWQGGTQEGPGNTVVGFLDLDATSSFVTLLGRRVEVIDRGQWNSGNINGSNGGSIYVSPNATFTGQPTTGGNFNAGPGDAPAFVNDGTVVVPGGNQLLFVARYVNNGTTTVGGTVSVSGGGASDGRITMEGGGLWNNASGEFTSTQNSIWDGDGTVSVSGGNLIVGGEYDPGTTRVAGGTITMTTDGSTENLDQTGGTLDTGGFDFAFGDAAFGGGKWTGGGNVSGNELTIDAGNSFVTLDGVTVLVARVGAWTEGNIVSSNGAVLIIEEDASFAMEPDGGGSMSWTVGERPTVENRGTVNVAGSTQVELDALLDNQNQVVVEGTLTLEVSRNTGDVRIQKNAEMNVVDYEQYSLGSIDGPGTLGLGAGDTSWEGSFNVDNVNITGGTHNFEAQAQTRTLSHSFGVVSGAAGIVADTYNFTGGTIRTVVTASEQMHISGSGFKHIDGGHLTGEGQGTWERGSVTMSNGAQWDFSYNIFIIEDVSAGIRNGGGDTSIVRNEGLFQVDTGGTITFDVDFNNAVDGTLELFDGSGFRVDGRVENIDPDTGNLSGGTWDLKGPVTTQNYSINIHSADADIGLTGEDAGFYDAQGNDLMEEFELLSANVKLEVSDRTVDILGSLAVEGFFALHFGDVNLDGEVNIDDFGELFLDNATVNADVYSEGDFNGDNGVTLGDFQVFSGSFGMGQPLGDSPGTGKMTVEQDYAQSDTATMVIDIAGRNPEIGFDWLNVGGVATLGGTLQVRVPGPFMPAPDDEFTFLTAGAVAGEFDAVDVPCLPGGTFDVVYGETSVTLRFTAAGRGDGNCDGRIDLDDYRLLAVCLSGPAGGIEPGCEAFNLDFDADVDMADFGAFQAGFTGN